jgi:hypothetical protein
MNVHPAASVDPLIFPAYSAARLQKTYHSFPRVHLDV